MTSSGASPHISSSSLRPTLWRLRLTVFCQMNALGLLFPFEGIWMKHNGLGEATIGALTALSTFLGLAAGLWWAHLADRTQCPQRIAALGYVLFGLSVAYLAACRTLSDFVLFSIARGLVAAMAMNMLPLMVVSILDRPVAGRGYASYRVFGSMGWILGTLLWPGLLGSVQNLILAAAAALLLAPWPLIGLKLPLHPHPHQPLHPLAVLRHRQLLGLFLALFLFSIGSPAVHRFSPLYARELGASTQFVGFFSSTNGMVALVGLVVSGIMTDRWGDRLLIWLALATQPLRVLGYGLVPSYPWLLVPQVLHFFTWAGLEIAGTLYVSHRAPPGTRATALTLFVSSQTLGSVAGSLLAGYLAEHAGYPLMFTVTALVCATALLVFALLRADTTSTASTPSQGTETTPPTLLSTNHQQTP